MAFKLTVGQYYAAPSPIHALDARVKLVCAIAVLAAIFCATNAAQLLLAAATTLALLATSHVPVSRIAASTRPLLAFLAVISLFNLLFVASGDTLLSAGPITVTTGGAWAAVLYTCRFALALQVGSLILLTTTPTQLADAIDALLSPLARVGLPAHQIAMVFALMLRFVPTLADETSAIIDAQALRGGAFDKGSPVRRLRAVVPVVTALLAAGLRHADGLSRALDARCYVGGAARTHLNEPQLMARDAAATAITVAFVALMVLAA